MRHRKHHGSLGLVTGHRRALLANLASALITHGRIETTHAKARAVRPYMEKLITLGKNGDLHSRRQALAKLRRPIVDKLFDDVASAFENRPGGYTRIIKTGFRAGDAAPMALIELVEAGFEVKPVKAAKKPTAKKEAAPAKEEAKAETEAEEVAPVEAAAADEAVDAAPEAAETTAEETKAEDK